jgi:hypothetical protein
VALGKTHTHPQQGSSARDRQGMALSPIELKPPAVVPVPH